MENLELARRLKSIFFGDKIQYNYSGKGALNRFDIAPDKGKRWKTPAEIALDVIKELGYASPYDIPDEFEQIFIEKEEHMNPIILAKLLELGVIGLQGAFTLLSLAGKSSEEIDDIYNDEKFKFEANRPELLPDVEKEG